MKPIPSVFSPEGAWALAGALAAVPPPGQSYLLWDGDYVLLRDGELYTHDDRAPDTWARFPDELVGDLQKLLAHHKDGVYHLCGPSFRGNPHGFETWRLMTFAGLPVSVARTAEGLKQGMITRTDDAVRVWTPGFVFVHGDGRLAQVLARDFGLAWPPTMVGL